VTLIEIIAPGIVVINSPESRYAELNFYGNPVKFLTVGMN